MRTVWLTASIDTEEDQWAPARRVSLRNIEQLPTVGRALASRGVRATYFSTQCVVEDPRARDLLGGLLSGGGVEIGAHLHPWNTRPFVASDVRPITEAESLVCLLPDALQEAKLASLTESITQAFGTKPTSFRAGRWALGPGTVRALERVGYAVDSSVMPGMSWAAYGGPSFIGACREVHRLSADAIGKHATGSLVEVPVSVGFTRRGLALWDRLQRTSATVRGVRRVSSLLYRSGLLRKVQLSPEPSALADLAAATRALIADGMTHLHVYWHSQSLAAGSPFVQTSSELDAFYRRLDVIIDTAHRAANVRMGTVSEVARALAPAR